MADVGAGAATTALYVMKRLVLAVVASFALSSSPAAADELTRLVSREDPSFDVAASRLAVGRNGRVYLASNRYVLAIDRDGTAKLGVPLTDLVVMGATANQSGIMAVASAHFKHAITLRGSSLGAIGTIADFLVSDAVGWTAPCDVEAGASGDFYAFDQNRNRIVRITAPGRIVTTYSLDGLATDLERKTPQLRVWERGQRFYVLSPDDGVLRVASFDGRVLWSAATRLRLGGDGWHGGFDVDDEGRALVLNDTDDSVQIYDRGGKRLAPLLLEMGAHKGRVGDIRVFGGDVLVKRPASSELFQVYDRTTGALRRVVSAESETLKVTFPGGPWTAGVPVPIGIQLSAGQRAASTPRWHVWLRPLGAADFQELSLRDGRVTPPPDAGGLYQLRISASLDGGASEHMIDKLIELRVPQPRGSISLFTAENRVYFGQGESIPVGVVARAQKSTDIPEHVPIQLFDGQQLVAGSELSFQGSQVQQLVLPRELTRALRAGRYRLTTEAIAGFTVASQFLDIGPGIEQIPRFSIVQHGDYVNSFPDGTLLDGPESIAAHLNRSRKLGVNMFVDRIGAQGLNVNQIFTDSQLVDALQRDPTAVHPGKAVIDGMVRQTIAGYGAYGIEERAILLNMDAGLPLGTGFDKRTPEQLAQAIMRTTTDLLPYPAFRGWSWAANWWVQQLGADAAATAEERAAYTAALNKAEATGEWSAVLDTVSDRTLGLAVSAERQLNAVLQRAGPGKRSVMTGPYRAIGVDPPVTFRNPDEVDLHFQSEQIQPPEVTPHNVDFYKRPGKRAWGHPELWNDDGTGGMILSTVFQMVMRGADGIGWSGKPLWGQGPSDVRASGPGTLTVLRSLDMLLREYGPWLTTLRSADRVAIVVSSRMLRIDQWHGVFGEYFERLYEAYVACLYAHRPASFVFAEDLTQDTLAAYQAVLVVGQRVVFEPNLAQALDKARASGVGVFHDGTCRLSLVQPLTALGVSFDKVENDASPWQDDSAYLRLTRYFEQDADLLRRILAPRVAPPADVDAPDVLLTERASGDARFVWVVDDVIPDLEPGLAWRTGLIMSQRLPLVASIGLNASGRAVYDVFGQRRVQLNQGRVDADLRSLPARLYAILPRPIDSIALTVPEMASPAQDLAWMVTIRDDLGKPLGANVPLRLQIVASDGSALSDQYLTTGGQSSMSGRWQIPVNAPSGGFSVLATELLSGKTAEVPIRFATSGTRTDITHFVPPPAEPNVRLVTRVVRDTNRSPLPIEERFGAHLKDVAVSRDGRIGVFNAMAWDENLYGLDLGTGEIRWRRRFGQHFSYNPESNATGFTAQAFDRTMAEGYALYLLDAAGQSERRFALYGVPNRATDWSRGSQLVDHDESFAVSPRGDWVASSGDLGMIVWGRDGTRWWSLDWWKTKRARMLLLAPDAESLVTIEGTTVTAHDAHRGTSRWTMHLANTGRVLGAAASVSGGTLVIRTDTSGGRLFVIEAGKLVGSIPSASDEVAVSPDGRFLAVTTGNQLRWYAATGGLLWSFTADDVLRNLRLSADGERVVAGSELGTVYVLAGSGQLLWQHDCGALPVATWLPGGDLLLGTWMGLVERLDAGYRVRWSVHVASATRDIRPSLLANDPTPTTRAEWGNAARTPAPLTPNLLTQTPVMVSITLGERSMALQNQIAMLSDANPSPPATPWLGWTSINYIDSGWLGPLSFNVDAYHTQLRVTGVTFVEDPAHPESWLRDVRLQFWDAGAATWRDGPLLLSNAAVHTHWLDRPIDAARFRLVSSGGDGAWPEGNLRLAELVFHGQVLGPSHPDVVARRAVAVLFDESDADVKSLTQSPSSPFAIRYGDAYSGGASLELSGAGMTSPQPRPPFGSALPNWDFEIAEHPRPGQYRWLQFAWKALSPQTTGISLLIGRPWPEGGYALVAGSQSWPQGVLVSKNIAVIAPRDWQVVRVDLWTLFHEKPVRIQALNLAATGGGAAFDQILLGRTQQELTRFPRSAP